MVEGDGGRRDGDGGNWGFRWKRAEEGLKVFGSGVVR